MEITALIARESMERFRMLTWVRLEARASIQETWVQG